MIDSFSIACSNSWMTTPASISFSSVGSADEGGDSEALLMLYSVEGGVRIYRQGVEVELVDACG